MRAEVTERACTGNRFVVSPYIRVIGLAPALQILQGEAPYCTDAPLLYQLPYITESRRVAIAEANHRSNGLSLIQLQQLSGLLEGSRKRLFSKKRLARFDTGSHDIRMNVVRRNRYDRFNISILYKLLEVSVALLLINPQLITESLQCLFVHITDSNNVKASCFLHPLPVSMRHSA